MKSKKEFTTLTPLIIGGTQKNIQHERPLFQLLLVFLCVCIYIEILDEIHGSYK